MTENQPTRLTTPRQREVFTTLLDAFLDEGLSWFTVDAAAARLHCSKSTLYALGRTGDDIVRRVLVAFFKDVTRRTERSLNTHPGPLNSLLAYFDAMGAAMTPASPAFMRDAASMPVAREVYDTNTRAAARTIGDLIAAAVESGEFRPVPVDFMTGLITAALEHIQQGATGSLEVSQAYSELGRLVVDGLAART